MRETKVGGLSGIRCTANQEVTPNDGAAVRRAYCSNSQNPGPNSGRAINVFPVRRLSGRRRDVSFWRWCRPSVCRKAEIFCGLSRFGCFGGGGDFLNFGVATAGKVLITGLDRDVALLSKGFEVFAHGGLEALVIELVHDFVLHLVHGLQTFIVMLEDLKDEEALLGLDDGSEFVALHSENAVLELLG